MMPDLIAFGSFHLSSFFLFSVIAWCFWSFFFWRHLRDYAVSEEELYSVMFTTTLFFLLFARAGYVFLHWNLFSETWLRMFTIWIEPGFSLYPGLLGAFLAMVGSSIRAKSMKMSMLMDAFSYAFCIAMIPGSIGSLLGGLVIGKPTTLPFGIFYYGVPERRHPVQAYELLAMILLVIAFALVKARHTAIHREKTMRDGMLAVGIFFWYSILMFCIEFFKTSSVYLVNLTINQWILIAIFGQAAGSWFVWGGGKKIGRGIMRVFYVLKRFFQRRIYAIISKRSA